ncbi:MAG: hypothetical protein AB9828_00720 [Sphaerochaetaceae bacterium]
MGKKVLILALVLLIAVTGTLTAASPSVIDIGITNMMSIADVTATNFEGYLPGIRLQWNFKPWIGMAVDAQALSYDFTTNSYDITAGVSTILRGPFGLVEPYLGIGSAFVVAIDNGAFNPATTESYFIVDARAGIDVNILSWLALGIEGDMRIDDLGAFVNQISTIFTDEDFLNNNILVGLNLKLRF